MDYEKKYKEALEKARMYRDNAKAVEDYSAVARYENIFPELRESEDERVRKALIEGVRQIRCKNGVTQEQMIAYLEKQKEQPMELLEPDKNVEKIIEDVIRVYGKTQGEWVSGYDIDTLIVNLRRAFGQKEQKPNYCHYGGDPNAERCRWCSAACSARLTEEQKPAEKQDYSGLNDLERAILRGFLCAGVENVPVGIIKDTAYECMGFLALIEPNPAEWSEEDEKMRTNAVLSLQYLIEEFPNADFIDSVKKEKAWLESFRPQPQGVYKQIVHSIYKMLKGKDFYGMSTSNCISLLNDIRVKCKDADECAKILDEPSRKSIEELLDALDVTLGNFINKLNAL